MVLYESIWTRYTFGVPDIASVPRPSSRLHRLYLEERTHQHYSKNHNCP